MKSVNHYFLVKHFELQQKGLHDINHLFQASPSIPPQNKSVYTFPAHQQVTMSTHTVLVTSIGYPKNTDLLLWFHLLSYIN